MNLVMTIIQMKFEHLRIKYEASIERKPFGVRFNSTIWFNTEIGLHEMRLHYQQTCESEQREAWQYYNFIFIE